MKFGDEALAIANTNDGGSYFFTDWAARNGMFNDPSRATGLMLFHVDEAGREAFGNNYIIDRYVLSYAPTNGFWSDVWGTFLTKLGFESESVLGLRSQLEYIQREGQQVNWVAHSRGGAEFVLAASGLPPRQDTSANNNSVVFHGGANTVFFTSIPVH